MNPNDILGFAQNMIRSNPNIANNPQSQQMVEVLLSGDAERGAKIAENLCRANGITPEQGMANAQNFFSQMLFGRR